MNLNLGSLSGADALIVEPPAFMSTNSQTSNETSFPTLCDDIAMACWKNVTLRWVIARSVEARAAEAVACLKPGGGREGSSSTDFSLSSPAGVASSLTSSISSISVCIAGDPPFASSSHASDFLRFTFGWSSRNMARSILAK